MTHTHTHTHTHKSANHTDAIVHLDVAVENVVVVDVLQGHGDLDEPVHDDGL